MKKIFLLFLVIPFVCFAQYEKEIDSIRSNIKTRKSLDEKSLDYLDLIGLTIDNGLDAEAKRAIAELKALNSDGSCPKCEATALYGEGNLYSVAGDFNKAVPIFVSAAKIYEEIGDKAMFLESRVKICESLMFLNKIPEAEKLLLATIREHKNDKVKIGMQGIYYLLASIYYDKKYYNSALNYFFETEKSIQPNHPNAALYKVVILSQIALVYMDQNNYHKAIEKITDAYNLTVKEKMDVRELEVIFIKGRIENHFGNAEKSIPYFKKCLLKAEELERPINANKAMLFLGESYYKLKQYKISIDYLKKSEPYFVKNQDEKYLPELAIYLAKNYLQTNNTEQFDLYIQKAEKLIGKNYNSSFYLTFLDVKIEKAIKNNQTSELIRFIKVKDSITNLINLENSLLSFEDLETKYQTEKKEGQIKLLSAQNELAQKQKYIYIGIVGLLLLIGGSLFYAYRNKIKTAQKLNELNELKSRFFANISHEFRTPLTLIKSPVQSLQSEISDVDQKNKLQLIDTNSTRMLALVDQLLELSKIDSGKLKLILKDGNIGSFLTSIIEPFEFQSKEKGILFTANIQKTVENSAFDKDVIEKIVTNLVSNAFKYSPENESIVFTSSVENSNLKVVVSNTGSELKKEDLPKLFERFYQKNQSQQGVGIGLALVKELVELYKGTITTSLENKELSFIVDLPLTMANENAVIIPPKDATSIIENATTSETELPILLLVDDNADIRNVLKDIFKENYQILEAEDGEQALKIALKEIPDCIISDVMMPKMDGFEFTKQIKTNELTSFIPILLLTAKTSDEAHLQGLKSTADAFLTKPFNNEIVKETVLQLIAERKKLQERYSQELVLRPTDIVINSIDEKFVARLQKTLDEHVSNAEFSSDDFARAVGMSRMQLHRKLKTLFGVSTTEFLRNERLKIAAELLRKENGNISDVAYAVGFNDVSYFSKCFKELYQCTPTEFVDGK